MKKLAIALSVLAALVLGSSANAETIDYTITGWQSTCSATTFTGTSTDCTFYSSGVGRLSGGTITGTAQFVGNSTSGGTLTVNSDVYVTSSTPSVPPSTISTSGHFDVLGDGTVVGGGGPPDTFICTPTDSVVCNTPNTPLAVANIGIYGPGSTPGGTLTYLVKALASASTNMAWQGYTLTVPEPGPALLGGAALLSLAAVGCLRRKRDGK